MGHSSQEENKAQSSGKGSQCPLYLCPPGSDVTPDSRLRVQVGAELCPVSVGSILGMGVVVLEANVGHNLGHP